MEGGSTMCGLEFTVGRLHVVGPREYSLKEV